MGRCYEFGIVVGEACEHAMVVPDPGGRCECATCGVVCTGRFAGCGAILDQPGYVPVTAPAWAVAVGTVEHGTSGGPAPAGAAPEVAPPSPPDSLAGLAELVETLIKQLAEHDADLVTRVDALAEQLAALQRQSAEQGAVVAQLAQAVTDRSADGRVPVFGVRRPRQ